MNKEIDRLLNDVDQEMVCLLKEVVAFETGSEIEPLLRGLQEDISLFTLPRLKSLPEA